MERVGTQQRRLGNKWVIKGAQHHLGGFLGFVALENKECVNHIKLCELFNVALKRIEPSSRDINIDEPLKKEKRRH